MTDIDPRFPAAHFGHDLKVRGVVVELDSRRRSIGEWMRCLWCWRRHWLRHPASDGPNKYHACPSCDETASLPAWRVERGI